MEKLIEYAPLLARGALVTIALALVSLVLATILGALGAAGKIGGGRIAKSAVLVYTTLVRGIPDLVLMLLVYFGGQRILNIIGGALGLPALSISPFWAGVLAIGFLYGAYLTETFRGAYMTIPKGQIEAGHALGMRGFRLHQKVTIPQLVRFALPGYANVWQVLVKSTAVVSVIGLQDLVGLADKAGKTAREPFIFFAAVLLVYLFFTFISTTIFDALERRYARGTSNAL
jgi:His/Glu/Gln/Arg/opine family amino acid ABC transporter permease subunit